MNIIEATTFLKKDKRIRRKAWPYGVYLAFVVDHEWGGKKIALKNGTKTDDGIADAFTTDSLTAEDWEVIE